MGHETFNFVLQDVYVFVDIQVLYVDLIQHNGAQMQFMLYLTPIFITKNCKPTDPD